MVEIKDDPYSAPSSSVLDENAKQQPRKLWPYLLLSLAAAFVGVGVHHLHNSSPLGMCPFHMFSTYTNSEGPVTNSDHYDSALYSEELVYGSRKKLADVYTKRVVTKSELAQHGGSSQTLWVSVLGHVFDVSSGLRHYGNQGTYNFFTGKDGSRAYSTGQFTDGGLIDDLSGMNPQQIGEIFHWINIYSKKYPLVGRLEGPFFSNKGLPTPTWREVESSLEVLGEDEEDKAALRKKYPSCNSHYDQSAGKAEVWCTEKSGGVSREWAGVPRQLHLPGESVRCACIEGTLLEDPKLKEYPDCLPSSISCKLKL